MQFSQYDHSRVGEALEKSLKKLGVAYVDLYLMHWPMAYSETGESQLDRSDAFLGLIPSGRTLQPDESPTFIETWKEMEKLASTGRQ